MATKSCLLAFKFAPANLFFFLLVLLSIPLLFLLLFLRCSIRGLVVVCVCWRAHGVHWANSTVADSGMGMAVASRRV